MGLFDTIAGAAGAALPGLAGAADGAPAGLGGEVADLIRNAGGLGGLLARFEQHGLGDTAGSWLGTGSNLPVSGEQLQTVLGSAQVQAIAERLGLPADAAARALAMFLPKVVDQLTPTGALPHDGLVEQGLAMLKGFGAGR